MSLPRPPHPHPVLFVLSGTAILAASVWMFLLILGSVYGRYDVADLVPTKQGLEAAFRKGRVAILSSGYSERMLAEGSLWLKEDVNAWQRFLPTCNLDYEVLGDKDVESGRLADFSLLVLPGARALSEREIVEIKKYIDRGGSVFASGGTGSFTEKGEWRGWDFLSQVFGLQFTGEITPDQETRLHTLRGGLPITAGIPAGYSLKVATWDRPIACEVLEPRTTQASTWYEPGEDSAIGAEALEKMAGIAYGTYGRGRFLWMGFELNAVLGGRRDYVFFDVLCRRSVDWLRYVPTILVRDWPGTHQAAAMITVSLAGEPENALGLVDTMRTDRVPLTFFVDPQTPALTRRLASSLASAGDVGALITTPDLAGTGTRVGLLSGRTATGAFPALGFYDEQDIHGLLEAGYRYVVSDSMSDRSVPEIIDRGDRSLVAFARTARGDNEVVRRFGLSDTSLELYTYLEDVDRVAFEGGLYMMRVHSDLQCAPDKAPVIRRLAQYIRGRNFWVATGAEIAQWWQERKALEVSALVRSKRRIALLISNPSRQVVENAVIQVNINKPVMNVTLSSDILGTKIPPYRFDPKSQIMEITVPSLAGSESLSLFIDYDTTNV